MAVRTCAHGHFTGLEPDATRSLPGHSGPDPQENFQFIKHGIKMTGMPAFGPTQGDDEIWALVAFLNVLPGISAADFPRRSAARCVLPVAPVKWRLTSHRSSGPS